LHLNKGFGKNKKINISIVVRFTTTLDLYTTKFIEFVNPIHPDQLGFIKEEILEVM
jgi:hypothetical protein